MTHIKNILSWLLLALFAFLIYVWNFGLWPRYFDITWNEEVQLHDGRVIVVHIKRTYQRLGMRLFQYDDAIGRLNEISFKTNPGHREIVLRTGLGLSFLDQIGGNWYLVLDGQGPEDRPEEPPSYWGHDFNQSEQRLAMLSGDKFVPIRWEQAPQSIQRRNLLFTGMPRDQLASISKKLITLDIKRQLEHQYPPHPEARDITRPLRTQQTRENNK